MDTGFCYFIPHDVFLSHGWSYPIVMDGTASNLNVDVGLIPKPQPLTPAKTLATSGTLYPGSAVSFNITGAERDEDGIRAGPDLDYGG